jgi:hypothetical protein
VVQVASAAVAEGGPEAVERDELPEALEVERPPGPRVTRGMPIR